MLTYGIGDSKTALVGDYLLSSIPKIHRVGKALSISLFGELAQDLQVKFDNQHKVYKI
jgi:hypothetical protein